MSAMSGFPRRASAWPAESVQPRRAISSCAKPSYYEKIKMLQAPPRTASGRRIYGPIETRVLAFIRRARKLGFTLDEIRALLDLGGPGKATCAEVHTIARRHLDDIRVKINDLMKLERLLAKTIARCSGKSVPNCPILDILDVERSKRRAKRNPALVTPPVWHWRPDRRSDGERASKK